MKTNQYAAITAALISTSAIVSMPALAATAPTTIPSIPVGIMSAYPTIVQTGTKPTLSWSILYPSKVSDLVVINPPGTLIPQDTVYTDVQIVGTETLCTNDCNTVVSLSPPGEIWQRFADTYQQLLCGTQMSTDPVMGRYIEKYYAQIKTLYTSFKDFQANPALGFGWGNHGVSESMSPYHTMGGANAQPFTTIATTTTVPLPTEARVSVNGGAYEQLFYGTQADVAPAHSLYIKKLLKGQTLDFGGRYVKDGVWSPFYTTRSSNLQVVALVNGDYPPTTFSLYRQNFLATYLRPYLDSMGRVNIGPLSVLIVMELDNSDHTRGCFDYQDMVLLVNLGTKHPNNGHGNNLDGVDVSNPGQGHGGPNGEVDPSGGVDDERK